MPMQAGARAWGEMPPSATPKGLELGSWNVSICSVISSICRDKVLGRCSAHSPLCRLHLALVRAGERGAPSHEQVQSGRTANLPGNRRFLLTSGGRNRDTPGTGSSSPVDGR